jgi:hypothetical protein
MLNVRRVIVDLPEQLLAVELERPEIMFVMWIVVGVELNRPGFAGGRLV